jgi:RNA polymerase sporulation-specific sigma factor
MNNHELLEFSKHHYPILSRDRINALAVDVQKMRALGKRKERNDWAAENAISIEELDRIVKKGTRSQHRLVESNLRLVTYVLSRKPKLAEGADPDDVFQIGCCGLIRAADCFDPARGTSFTTLAFRCICNSLLTARRHRMNETVKFGSVASQSINNIFVVRKAMAELHSGLGRHPNVNEVAAHSGLSVQKAGQAIEMLRVSTPAKSLNAPVVGEGFSEFLELLDSVESPHREDEDLEADHAELHAMISELKPEHQAILKVAFGLGTKRLNTYEMGRALGLTRDVARSTLATALRALKYQYSLHGVRA